MTSVLEKKTQLDAMCYSPYALLITSYDLLAQQSLACFIEGSQMGP